MLHLGHRKIIRLHPAKMVILQKVDTIIYFRFGHSHFQKNIVRECWIIINNNCLLMSMTQLIEASFTSSNIGEMSKAEPHRNWRSISQVLASVENLNAKWWYSKQYNMIWLSQRICIVINLLTRVSEVVQRWSLQYVTCRKECKDMAIMCTACSMPLYLQWSLSLQDILDPGATKIKTFVPNNIFKNDEKLWTLKKILTLKPIPLWFLEKG